MSPSNLERHVRKLAGEIGERNIFRPRALEEAAAYIEEEWHGQGYRVERQVYRVRGVDCANLEVTRPGSERPGEIVLLGAHYDSVHGSPGANDNGTGVAALLELSRRLSPIETARTVRFVAFVNEEPPFFRWKSMGSMVYAREARKRRDDIRVMISLETIGYFTDAPGSQRYPPLFRYFYPDCGNFIALVSNFRSRRWLRRAAAAFRSHSDFPLEQVATFGWIPGVSWSDHLAFWRQGYRALMLTDTAFYRYAYYHTAEDTPDKACYPELAELTEGLRGMTADLAEDV